MIGKSMVYCLFDASTLTVMPFVLFNSSITSPNMYGDKTLVIVASDLVHAEENFGS
jgi:hypothetical protein